MKNRILIVDDDKELCSLLQKSVSIEEIIADCYYSGHDALTALADNDYQLVVLDIMMPGIDGFETLEKIREISSVPILMLTSKNDSSSKVHGLRMGADDYLTKPFDMDEFLARVSSLIRRYTRLNTIDTQKKMLYDDLIIDLDNRTVTVRGRPMVLPPKEFGILLFCARNQGRILTKQQIYEEVWKEPYAYDDSNIMALISRLRKKIEPDPKKPTYIQTVKGIGYRFNREV
ncbi:response regulator transcription factor [Clostridium tyrobutyricum]|uniref:response regulator transcription factor n=1 Tax=Clostridium tyrobutyricum TaxID=1519 RepID=UPI001C38D4C6|nr:response regulator transcription factor [Clostridium tyrobutyricum]MBV4431683.1 response regulator transcription factor [Clostridium tyrobutyricum]